MRCIDTILELLRDAVDVNTQSLLQLTRSNAPLSEIIEDAFADNQAQNLDDQFAELW